MRLTEDTERFNDVDAYDENDTPVCVCADYIGTTHVTFCKACHDYTDTIEIAKMEAAEKPAAIAVSAPRKPMAPAYSYASIGNGLYCRVGTPKKSRNRRGF